jgi:uroporphyrin-III C-methyltransferase
MLAVGKVFLIGAGPGDVELLTLKAVKALGQADVVLLDDLVSREILRFVPATARVIEVGKRGGCRSTPQAFIERQLVHLARAGNVVARVKGGDPFVFGRGGEEMQALVRAGVAVEVVTGITAGIGVPATLGIPVTHRDFTHGVTLVTGHARAGASVDWGALARSGTTLVIYMATTNLLEITGALRDAGMASTMPACAIQHGTLPAQRNVVATLATLTDAVAAAGLTSPAIVVIGETVRFARVASVPIAALRAA